MRRKKKRKPDALAHYLNGNDLLGCGLSQNISKKLRKKWNNKKKELELKNE